MTMFWPLLAVIAVAVVLVIVAREVDTTPTRQVERTFACPVTGEEVTAVLQSDFFEPEHYHDVIVCSRFGLNRAPQCELACLALAKREIAEQDAVRLPVYIG